MRRLSGVTLSAAVLAVVLVLGLGAAEVRAQGVVGGGYSGSYRVSDYLGSPGLYGMSYGFASYGMPQTYSVFSAMPGPSYGTTYPPYGLMPGKYGVGLWRPGFVAPGYVYGASYYYPASSYSYRTFSVANACWDRESPLAAGRCLRAGAGSTYDVWLVTAERRGRRRLARDRERCDPKLE